jgi:cation transport protein ChaC
MTQVTTGSSLYYTYFHSPYLWSGYVEGYARRFWQGNETHRGQPGQPGRVATLVEEAGTSTYGLALELKGEDALEYLNNRNGDREHNNVLELSGTGI